MNGGTPLPDVDQAVVDHGLACMDQEAKGTPLSRAKRAAAFEAYQEAKRKWEEAMRADDRATIQMQAAVIEELRNEVKRLRLILHPDTCPVLDEETREDDFARERMEYREG